MQLNLCNFIIIVSLLVSIILSEYRKEYRNGRGHSIGRIRNGRTTYVKAILSNPKLSPSQQLAQKLARAELDSPKMQETFKKLTAVHSTGQNSRDISGFARSVGDFENSHKPQRFQGPLKHKTKRHKSYRCNGGRRINSNKRKAIDHHLRLTRQTKNSMSKTRRKGFKNRYGKSIQDPNELSNGSDNNQNFNVNPSANLDLESFNTNQQSLGINDNSLNYLPNYSSLNDQNDNLGNLYADINQDFLTSNSQSEQFIPLNYNNSYQKNFLVGDDNYETRERQNSLQSNQFKYQNPYEISNNQFSISDGSPYLRYRNNQNIMPTRLEQRKKFRTFGNLNSGQFSNSASSQRNHQSGPMTKSQKLPGKTMKEESIIGRNEYMKQQARRAPKIEKSEESMKKSVSETNESCTTTEMNPKLKGIGEASAVPSEIVEKAVAASKTLKGTEYHLLPMNSNEPQAAREKTSLNEEMNSTSLANETKEVADQILNKLIEELEDLKLNRTENDQKEGLPCRLSGSWITTVAGVRIDMLVTNRTVNVSMAKLDLPVGIARQGVLNYTWNITGYAPFKRGGPFSLTATDDHMKSLAVFVGACRVCQGIDTIEGVWSIAREPRDCRDFQVATSIYNDIFRKTKLLSAIKERHLELTSTTKCTSTTTVATTKEENLSAALRVDKKST